MTVLSDRVDALEATNANLVSVLSGLTATMNAQIAAGRGLVWQGDWATATAYTTVDAVANGGSSYVCILDHTSSAATEPGVGASWENYWDLLVSSGGEWRVDAGAPASGLGIDGDFYLNNENGDVYFKASGSWTLQLNIEGPIGADGPSGGQWFSGTGAPSSGLGADGDFYLDDANGDVYSKAAGAWTIADNLTGPAGLDGDGFTGGTYDAGTGIVTFTSDDGLGFSTLDLRGAAGADGDGFTGGSYDAGTGVVTFTSDDGLGFATGDLRGADLDWRGAWATATAYAVNDAVSNGGSSYVCISAHTSGSTTEPGVGASWQAEWDLMASAGADGADGTNGTDGADGTNGTDGADGLDVSWRGAWVTSTAYAVNDAVSSGGSSYICTSAHTSGSTTEPGVGASWQAEWDLMAAKGAAGAGSGDMIAATYDPQAIAGDAFSRANHTGTQLLSTVSDAGTAAALDAPAAGDAAVGEVVKGDDTRLSDARTPTAHTHTLSEITDAGTAAGSAIGDFATAAQGALADSAQQPPSEGAFVDGDKTKLDGVETGADVTDTANVTAAGALMDSEVTNLAQVKAFNSADYAVADGDVLDVTFTPTNYTPDATPAEAADVDDLAAHLQGIDTALGAAGGGGLVFLASTDISSAATVDFTAFDGTQYDAYKFVLQNVIPATDNVELYLRTSTDGGSTYDSGASDYLWAGSMNSFEAEGSGGQVEISAGEGIGNGAGEDGISGTIEIAGPHLAKETYVNFHVSFDDNGLKNCVGGGVRNSSADVDAVRLLMSSGNITSGTITMYGMVNA